MIINLKQKGSGMVKTYRFENRENAIKRAYQSLLECKRLGISFDEILDRFDITDYVKSKNNQDLSNSSKIIVEDNLSKKPPLPAPFR
jgi:hypothetical protein